MARNFLRHAHTVVTVAATGSCSRGYALRSLWSRLRSDKNNLEVQASSEDISLYEKLASVDQVLKFFEKEYERHIPYVEDEAVLEKMRIEYYNCVSGIEFQNEVIAQLVEELIDLRTSLRELMKDMPRIKTVPDKVSQYESTERNADGSNVVHPCLAREHLPTLGVNFNAKGFNHESSMTLGLLKQQFQDTTVRLAHVKLDIGERKNKRRTKERERHKVLEQLSPVIADIKMRRFSERDAPELASASHAHCSHNDGSFADAHVLGKPETMWSSSFSATETSAKLRYKHYTDDELASLLRDQY